MPSWSKMPFDDADAALDLSELEFDVDFDSAYVNTGSIHVDGDWTGGDLFRRCGLDPNGRYLGELTAFVIDGDLTVDGTLDLDAGTKESFALIVTGALRAQVLTLDATMLFVVNDAHVSRLINFTTTDGTLSIAGTTHCPLVICDEGDLNLDSTGYIVCRVHETRSDGGSPDPEPTITLSRAEVPALLLDGLYNEDRWVDAEQAVSWARAGRPLLRSVTGA
jgi:hypothetical protein